MGSLGIVPLPHLFHGFSRKMFLMLHCFNWPVSLSDYLYFLRYWSKCVLQLFVHQIVTSYNLKLTLSFSWSCFDIWTKSQDKNLNIFRMERAFEVKKKAFFTIFKEFSISDLRMHLKHVFTSNSLEIRMHTQSSSLPLLFGITLSGSQSAVNILPSK